MFYWLRRCRGASCTTAIIIVLGAMIASETILYVFSFIPRMVHCLIFAMAVLAQYAAIAAARRKPLPAEIDIKSTSRGYFHFAQKNADSVRFLGIIAAGSFLMSIAIGFLKGFPNGDPIPFTHVTRLLYALLIDGVFIGLLWGTIKGKKSTMTIGTWVVMQGLGSIALLLFAIFPDRLDIGAVFGNAMNVTMTGFILYLIIAFSSYGHRDAYYYAQFPSTSLPTALCGGLLLISAQFIFLQFLMLERDETAATKATAISVQRLLGIKDEAAPGTEMRKAIVRASAQEMQKQFLLSDRETEVLASKNRRRALHRTRHGTHAREAYLFENRPAFPPGASGLHRAIHRLASAEEKPARECLTMIHIGREIAQKARTRRSKRA